MSSGLLRALAKGAVLSPFKRPTAAVRPPERRIAARVRVDGRGLERYREICGFEERDGVVPLTYPHVLGFPAAMRLMSARDFPLPVLGLVHTSISIRQERDLHSEEELELTVHTDRLTPHRRGTEAHVVTRARVAGEAVWESRSTYLARHATSRPSTPASAPAQEETEELPVAGTCHMPADLGRRYAAVSGDRNPIHLFPFTARLLGYRRPIAHGMWTVAHCLARFGAHGSVRMNTRFTAPVLLPATVVYARRGTAFALRDSSGRAHLTGRVLPLDEDRGSNG